MDIYNSNLIDDHFLILELLEHFHCESLITLIFKYSFKNRIMKSQYLYDFDQEQNENQNPIL